MADSSMKPVGLESALEGRGLSTEEDNELRQLTWFSLVGNLSDGSQARLLELRAKDRRSKVRNPRPDPSVSRMGAPELQESSARLVPEDGTPPGNFICPNCGYVQRGPGVS